MNTRSTIFLILAGAAVFLFLALWIDLFYSANYFGFIGRVGTAFLKEYFGIFSLVLPVVIVLAAASYKKRGEKHGLITLLLGILLVVLLGAAVSFVFVENVQAGRLSQRLAGLLKGPFGSIGTAIVLIIATVILSIAVFGLTFKDVSKRFKK